MRLKLGIKGERKLQMDGTYRFKSIPLNTKAFNAAVSKSGYTVTMYSWSQESKINSRLGKAVKVTWLTDQIILKAPADVVNISAIRHCFIDLKCMLLVYWVANETLLCITFNI